MRAASSASISNLAELKTACAIVADRTRCIDWTVQLGLQRDQVPLVVQPGIFRFFAFSTADDNWLTFSCHSGERLFLMLFSFSTIFSASPNLPDFRALSASSYQPLALACMSSAAPAAAAGTSGAGVDGTDGTDGIAGTSTLPG